MLPLMNISSAALGGLAAMGIFVVILIIVAAYVLYALIWSSIAKKLGYDKHWLAWIPIANMFLYPILAGKKWGNGFWLLLPIVNAVLLIIWSWKIFEKRHFSGWWNIILILAIFLSFVPILGQILELAYLVVLCFVAWKK